MIKILFILLRPSDGHKLTLEQGLCLRYECFLWVQSMSADNISFYCKQIESVQQSPVHHALLTYLYWRKTFATDDIPFICFSSLLSINLTSMVSNLQKYKLHDIKLICNLTMKILHFQSHPLLLASFMMQSLSESVLSEAKSAEDAAKLEVIVALNQYAINHCTNHFREEMCTARILGKEITDVSTMPLSLSESYSTMNHHCKFYFREVIQIESLSDGFIVNDALLSTFSISDKTLLSIASLKWYVQQLVTVKNSIRDIGMYDSFGCLSRVLINILMV